MIEVISLNNEYINRRSFMLHIAKPYPEPTLIELMETARNFKGIDGVNLGLVSKDVFMEVCYAVFCRHVYILCLAGQLFCLLKFNGILHENMT